MNGRKFFGLLLADQFGPDSLETMLLKLADETSRRVPGQKQSAVHLSSTEDLLRLAVALLQYRTTRIAELEAMIQSLRRRPQ